MLTRRGMKNNKLFCISGEQTEHSTRPEGSSCVLGNVAERKTEIREA